MKHFSQFRHLGIDEIAVEADAITAHGAGTMSDVERVDVFDGELFGLLQGDRRFFDEFEEAASFVHGFDVIVHQGQDLLDVMVDDDLKTFVDDVVIFIGDVDADFENFVLVHTSHVVIDIKASSFEVNPYKEVGTFDLSDVGHGDYALVSIVNIIILQ